MTVNTALNKITYLGDGGTTAFVFTFPGVNAQSIQVFITDASGNVTLASPTTYSVTLNPPVAPNPTSTGGVVNYPLVGSPLGIGTSITIFRNLTPIQAASLANQSVLYPTVIESEFDYLTMLDQQNQEISTRAILVPVGDPIPAPLPSVAQRMNQGAFFDANGNMVAGLPPAGGVVVSIAMQPVVTAPTITAAQNAMGIPALIASATASVFTTGDIKPTLKTVADATWVMMNDGSIGDASSGSTTRANADTNALFTLLYGNCVDADVPIQTLTGAATTRAAQGTAATAFAAHCRLVLPKILGRAMSGAGSGAILTPRPLGSTTGTETHAMTVGEIAAHNHPINISDPHHAHGYSDPGHVHGMGYQPIYGAGSQNAIFSSGSDTTTASSQTNIVISAAATGISATSDNTGSGTPFGIMQPATFVNFMIKL